MFMADEKAGPSQADREFKAPGRGEGKGHEAASNANLRQQIEAKALLGRFGRTDEVDRMREDLERMGISEEMIERAIRTATAERTPNR